MVELLNAVTSIAILLIVCSGLAVIQGLMNVINLAHPGLIAIGAYGALEASRLGVGPWPAILLGTGVTALVGLLMELLVVRRLYHRPLDSILATWGLALAIWQVLALVFGRAAFPYEGPQVGLVSLGSFSYSGYRLILLGIAVAIFGGLELLSRYTSIGLVARAVMTNESLAQALGINTAAVRRWTFTLGAAMAGAAGALLAPLAPVNPFLGLNYLILAFLAVLLAGKTVMGLVLGATILSGGESLVSMYGNPVFATAAVSVVAVIILRFVPEGFARLGRAA